VRFSLKGTKTRLSCGLSADLLAGGAKASYTANAYIYLLAAIIGDASREANGTATVGLHALYNLTMHSLLKLATVV